MSLETPALHDALQLLDVGGNAAVSAGVDRVRARMLAWPSSRSAPSKDVEVRPVITAVLDEARIAPLGMFAPLPDQVILNILERLHGNDLYK
jgi:hypothetical protein